jgi:hypothetical protein
MSSGDVTPFELTMIRQYDRASMTITMSQAGELEIKNNDQKTF